MNVTKSLPMRRKQQGITNYRKRLTLLKGNVLRAVVRKSLKHIVIQIVEFDARGDKVVLCADSKALPKYGWKAGGGNIPAAYLTGYLLGVLAKKKHIEEAILDIGLQTSSKGARIYAALKGMVDGGLQIPCSDDNLPDEGRLMGKHVQSYSQTLQKDKEAFLKQFSGYLKAGINPLDMEKQVALAKGRIKEAA
ncbi:50S ribosomal protein L18 [Candidatus Woesearchaeota archaeon]|nr:50S ribosomal protein L18 [Candidatus Woesearchaeota archaeon]